MNPQLFKIIDSEVSSFQIRINQQAAEYDHLHFHPEFQISLILAGSGITSIGNYLGPFQENEIYIIGPNIPHVFKNAARHYLSSGEHLSHVISLFFKPSVFGKQFFQMPEMASLKKFLADCERCVKLRPKLVLELRPKILELSQTTGGKKIVQFLNLLVEIAERKEKQFLSTSPPEKPKVESSIYQRINRIFSFISENFDRPIRLEEMARLSNLSKYAFCRFFKKITHKSFVTYLSEFRIGMACRLLRKTDYSVSQIGFLSGFNNLSNFNRHFKKYMNCTPSEYRLMYLQLMGEV